MLLIFFFGDGIHFLNCVSVMSLQNCCQDFSRVVKPYQKKFSFRRNKELLFLKFHGFCPQTFRPTSRELPSVLQFFLIVPMCTNFEMPQKGNLWILQAFLFLLNLWKSFVFSKRASQELLSIRFGTCRWLKFPITWQITL